MNFPSHVYAPIPANCARHLIEAFAESAGQRFGFYPDTYLANTREMKTKVRMARVHQIIERIGGRIIFESLHSGELNQEQSLIVYPDGKFQIAILSKFRMEKEEENWAVAQELGHFLLHYPLVVKKHGAVAMAAKRYPTQDDAALFRARMEAIWFAHALMMPAKAFMDAYRDGRRPFTMGYRFGVPARIAETRYQYLSELKAVA